MTMKYVSFTFLLSFMFHLYSFSQSVASYNISLTTIWNAAQHTSVPANAHWSALVGATHNTENEFFQLGVPSPNTNGIKDVAELGNNTNFMNEVNTAIGLQKADQWINAGGLPNAEGTFSITNLQVSDAYPLITLVSMVAPSPDWFIAVNSISLRSGNNSVNNGWKDSFTLDVFAYDAGTDDGTDYASANAISNPRVGVYKITSAPINGNKMGTITFTYNGSTLQTSNHSLSSIYMYPNPTKNNVTIKNLKGKHVNSIQLYNLLGGLVHNVIIDENLSETTFSVAKFQKGLYLLRLQTNDGQTEIRKLIVE